MCKLKTILGFNLHDSDNVIDIQIEKCEIA